MTVRYFHIRPNVNNGGATVRVEGDFNGVKVQVAFCHTHSKNKATDKGDVYSRKRGREVAEAAPEKYVPLRYLPKELERIHDEAMQRCGYGCVASGSGAYDFAIKYFLPKE